MSFLYQGSSIESHQPLSFNHLVLPTDTCSQLRCPRQRHLGSSRPKRSHQAFECLPSLCLNECSFHLVCQDPPKIDLKPAWSRRRICSRRSSQLKIISQRRVVLKCFHLQATSEKLYYVPFQERHHMAPWSLSAPRSRRIQSFPHRLRKGYRLSRYTLCRGE